MSINKHEQDMKTGNYQLVLVLTFITLNSMMYIFNCYNWH